MKTPIALLCLTCAALAQTMPQPNSPSYVIGRGDTLYISVWQYADFTNTFPVSSKGSIKMPLLGNIKAAGLTPMQLKASITEKLKKYVENPNVRVYPLEHGVPEYHERILPDLQDGPGGIIFKG